MLPLFHAWLIDPYLETVTPIELTDSLSDISRWVGSVEIGFFLKQVNSDQVIMNNNVVVDMMLPPAWKWLPTGELYYGRTIWININEEGQLSSPSSTIHWLQRQLEFVGFLDIQIETIFIEGMSKDEDDEDDEDDWKQYLSEQGNGDE